MKKTVFIFFVFIFSMSHSFAMEDLKKIYENKKLSSRMKDVIGKSLERVNKIESVKKISQKNKLNKNIDKKSLCAIKPTGEYFFRIEKYDNSDLFLEIIEDNGSYNKIRFTGPSKKEGKKNIYEYSFSPIKGNVAKFYYYSNDEKNKNEGMCLR